MLWAGCFIKANVCSFYFYKIVASPQMCVLVSISQSNICPWILYRWVWSLDMFGAWQTALSWECERQTPHKRLRVERPSVFCRDSERDLCLTSVSVTFILHVCPSRCLVCVCVCVCVSFITSVLLTLLPHQTPSHAHTQTHTIILHHERPTCMIMDHLHTWRINTHNL